MPYPRTSGPPPAPDFPGPDDPDAPEEDRPAIAADAVDRLLTWGANGEPARYHDDGVDYYVSFVDYGHEIRVEVEQDDGVVLTIIDEAGTWSGATFTATSGRTWTIEHDADGYKIASPWVLLTVDGNSSSTTLHKRVV